MCMKDPEIPFHLILIVVGSRVSSGKQGHERIFQISEIGNVFAYNAGTKKVMDKQRSRLDSTCLKDPEISFHRILIIIGSHISDRRKGYNRRQNINL